jgi:hypothetical protein
MKLTCLACEALARVVYLCAAQSPHVVDVTLFKIGLHNDPDDLRARLQAQIDGVGDHGYDAVVLAYGLCGKATAGLTARQVPLVLPRAHDCITLFLGARARYQAQFEAHPGTYWYVQDYIERREHASTSLSLGAPADGDVHDVYEEYVAKYGQDNADYLMEVMGAWQQHYQRAAYIDMGVGDGSRVEAETRATAARRGWTFDRLAGDLVLVRHLLHGQWDDDVLVVPPGQRVAMSYDEDVVCAAGETHHSPNLSEKGGKT